MVAGSRRAEIPLRLLLANPGEKRRQLRRRAQLLDRRVLLGKLLVRKDRVDLLVTRFAERFAMLRLAAAFLGEQVMLRDERCRHRAPAERTRRRGSVAVVALVFNDARHTGLRPDATVREWWE